MKDQKEDQRILKKVSQIIKKIFILSSITVLYMLVYTIHLKKNKAQYVADKHVLTGNADFHPSLQRITAVVIS